MLVCWLSDITVDPRPAVADILKTDLDLRHIWAC
jgi:hypothetical protein